ncbi:hypothetical protein [Candidatus Viadribacter manganicus]|uniref:Uncharacterized protein n=1 Tax=Candidatus Viadribacter manganicus TaxID=1759059 RepID=A0A1B1AHA0_9PROT|nr:hypothetical protein [Candidatus Viadribacter manganicus]ANP45928.1 hypothetical protein ATE48_08335 [Candidatus Viadribacter manganicus]
MRYVCDAPNGATWFRFETEAEAEAEAALMRHVVDKYFRRYEGAARETYRAPQTAASFEQAIGLKDHIAKAMPLFLTLRAADGEGLATAMLPPGGRNQANFRIVIVGPANADPYENHEAAIEALAQHFNIELPREECFPYA